MMKTMNRMRAGAALQFLVIAVGCAMGAQRPATTATSQPAAEVRTLRLSAAVPIGKFRDDDRHVDLRQLVHVGQGADEVLYFGQADGYDSDGEARATQPVIVANVHGDWSALSLKDDRLSNDALTPADDVPEDQGPAPLKETPVRHVRADASSAKGRA